LRREKGTTMAQHEVKFTVPERPLGKADVEFGIKRDGEMLGRLKVSNGTIVWVPKNKRSGYKLGWREFDGLMQKRAKSEK
jgi:hypothetical protein